MKSFVAWIMHTTKRTLLANNPRPVGSLGNLRKRVDRLLKAPAINKGQTETHLFGCHLLNAAPETDSDSVHSFLDFLGSRLTNGGLFLFGGVLRDIALFGKRGFHSDIDLVVTENWDDCVVYLTSKGAVSNKFGGLRLDVDNRQIDVWSAQQTWAIRQGLVEFRDIASLTETTAFNWDSILMNWTQRYFIIRANYLDDIQRRRLDMVLAANPNPLGTAVRAFRYTCAKNAKEISPAAASYMAKSARMHSLDRLRSAEHRSYGNSVIHPAVYRFFRDLDSYDNVAAQRGVSIADEIINLQFRFD
jgi:hypothetical protein